MPDIDKPFGQEDLNARICDAYGAGWIDHATWCNALRYMDGDYQDHGLCRRAFLIAVQPPCGAVWHGYTCTVRGSHDTHQTDGGFTRWPVKG